MNGRVVAMLAIFAVCAVEVKGKACDSSMLSGRILVGIFRNRLFYFKFPTDLAVTQPELLPDIWFGDEIFVQKDPEVKITHLLPFSGGRLAIYFQYRDGFYVSYRYLSNAAPTSGRQLKLYNPLKFRLKFKNHSIDTHNIFKLIEYRHGSIEIKTLKRSSLPEFETIASDYIYREANQELLDDEIKMVVARSAANHNYMCTLLFYSNYKSKYPPYYRTCRHFEHGVPGYSFRVINAEITDETGETCTLVSFAKEWKDDFEMVHVLHWDFLKRAIAINSDEEVDANPHSISEMNELFVGPFSTPPVFNATTNSDKEAESPGGPPIGLIIGIVCAVLFLLLAVGIGIALFFYIRKKKRNGQKAGAKAVQPKVEVSNEDVNTPHFTMTYDGFKNDSKAPNVNAKTTNMSVKK